MSENEPILIANRYQLGDRIGFGVPIGVAGQHRAVPWVLAIVGLSVTTVRPILRTVSPEQLRVVIIGVQADRSSVGAGSHVNADRCLFRTARLQERVLDRLPGVRA